jgi:two-component system, chemotaxis family, chemotaxis protein CheY
MKKVLVIDDSPSIRQQVALALGPAGYAVVEAADGVEAMEALASTTDIGLVITDINMPRMNGLEMLERIKHDEHNKSLPVMMLTSEGQPAMIDQARRGGACGWIVKPFKPELLLAAVRRLLPVLTGADEPMPAGGRAQ